MNGDVLSMVLDQLPPGSEAEVVMTREELALTRFANSHIHQKQKN